MADLTEMVTAKEFGASAGSGFMILFLDLAVSPHATPPRKSRQKSADEKGLMKLRSSLLGTALASCCPRGARRQQNSTCPGCSRACCSYCSTDTCAACQATGDDLTRFFSASSPLSRLHQERGRKKNPSKPLTNTLLGAPLDESHGDRGKSSVCHSFFVLHDKNRAGKKKTPPLALLIVSSGQRPGTDVEQRRRCAQAHGGCCGAPPCNER